MTFMARFTRRLDELGYRDGQNLRLVYRSAEGQPDLLPGLASELVGLSERALEMTVAYVKERKQFGVPVGSYQAVSHRCAQMLLDTEKARSTTAFAAWADDRLDRAYGIWRRILDDTPTDLLAVRICDTNHKVEGCNESGVTASPNMSVQIEDANGFIDDNF